MFVEGDKEFHNPLLIFISDGSRNFSIQFFFSQDWITLQQLGTGEGLFQDTGSLAAWLNIVFACKRQVKRMNKSRMLLDALEDIICIKSFMRKSTLEITHKLGMCGISGVEEG